MAQARLVSSRPLGRAVFPSVDAVVARVRPTDPLLCLRPAAIAAAARRFVDCFPGDVLYAVKCNPEPRGLAGAVGRRHQAFRLRLASPRSRSCASCCRRPRSISCTRSSRGQRSARRSTVYGVNDFALDSADELAKILQETVPVGLVGDPPILGLFVRLALPKGGAVYDLSGKFGAPLEEASTCCARRGRTPPVSASPSMSARNVSSPTHYARAIAFAGEAIARCRCRRRHRRCRRRLSGQLSRHGAAAARRLHRRDRGRRGRSPGDTPSSGPSPAGRSSPAAGRSWCRCSCAAATRSSSMTASMAA